MGRKRILLIATGGTIASHQDTNGLAPGITAEELLHALPSLATLCDVASCELFRLDSSNIQPEEWRVMAETIRNEQAHYDGFVIAHGTDTMAYTAAALSFMLRGLGKPVILTGSQLPLNHPLTDARINLMTAFTAACLAELDGVFVAFDRMLIAGTRASKVRTLGFDAFESINTPPVAIMDSGFNPEAPEFSDWGRPSETSSMPDEYHFKFDLDPRVFLLKLIPGTRTEFFDGYCSHPHRKKTIAPN